jgi:hypothetical protein
VVAEPHFPFARRRAAAALLLALVVLVLHAWMLGTWQPAPSLGRVPAVSVRQVVVAVAPSPTAAEALPPAPRSVPEPRPIPAPAAPQAATVPAPPPQPRAEADPRPELPTYATRLPAAATLRFETERRQRGGWAELRWQPGEQGYTLALQGLGALGVGATSQGGFDAAGLAPLRHAELRRGREVRAANFQRDSGRITFSGPAVEHPLLPGSQDRLSWLVQLAGVLNADSTLAEPGAQLHMVVAGTRGDAEVWTFTVQPRAALEVPAGRVERPVHLLREPRRPYDTEVQVWLDPAREHLPVQLWLRLRATGEGTEYRLVEAGP